MTMPSMPSMPQECALWSSWIHRRINASKGMPTCPRDVIARAKNGQNTSGVVGVIWNLKDPKYVDIPQTSWAWDPAIFVPSRDSNSKSKRYLAIRTMCANMCQPHFSFLNRHHTTCAIAPLSRTLMCCFALLSVENFWRLGELAHLFSRSFCSCSPWASTGDLPCLHYIIYHHILYYYSKIYQVCRQSAIQIQSVAWWAGQTYAWPGRGISSRSNWKMKMDWT